VLEKGLERIYRKNEEPLLSDLYKELKEGIWDDGMKGQAQAITSELMAYCEGVYSLLLSRNSRIRPFEKQITVFDLAGMKEHRILQSVMVSVIAFSLNRQLEDRSVRRVICIDEAWEFFNDAASAELVERLYRQARKQNAAIITLSQSPVEFLNSPASPAILGNSHWCMALKMASAHELLAKFGFTDQSIEHAKQMQIRPRAFSEVCVRYGDNSPRILRIAPTSKEYWIATTNADECVREAALRIKNKTTIIESIAAMAKGEPVLEW
jgi:type IV secretory pathway VirB4 component